MASSNLKYALVPIFLAASAVGGYSVMSTLFQTGFQHVLDDLADGRRAALVGAPEPFKRVYTSFAPVDRFMSILVGFFSALIDGDVPWNAVALHVWALAQLGGGWTLLLFDALRAGNRGRLSGWVGTFGVLIQIIGWTTGLPLYLLLHVFTSPVARLRGGDGRTARAVLFAFLWDMALIPSSVTLTYVLPAILMSLPTLMGQSAAAHYTLIAFWICFPGINVGAQEMLHKFCYFAVGSLTPMDEAGNKTTAGRAYMVGAQDVYKFALSLMMTCHVPILALALAPAPLREMLAAQFPGYRAAFEQVTFADTFLPYLPGSAPQVSATGYKSGEVALYAADFLRFDVLIGCVPFILWALYLNLNAAKKPSLAAALRKIAMWTVLGGPHAAVAVLLWERDEVVLEDDVDDKKDL